MIKIKSNSILIELATSVAEHHVTDVKKGSYIFTSDEVKGIGILQKELKNLKLSYELLKIENDMLKANQVNDTFRRTQNVIDTLPQAEIYDEYQVVNSYRELGEKYGVSHETIRTICKAETEKRKLENNDLCTQKSDAFDVDRT
jgi:Mor family transcriptional regulator